MAYFLFLVGFSRGTFKSDILSYVCWYSIGVTTGKFDAERCLKF